jgi:hypothetical protein
MQQPSIGYDLTPATLQAFANNTSITPAEQATTGKKLNFLGWGVLLLGLYALNGTSSGHEIIYMSLVLIVLFLFTAHYQAVLGVLTK